MKLAGAITPSALCAGENAMKTLIIPIYQRLFVWGEEQICNLLRDLKNSWKQCKQEGRTKDYHLGVITVHEDRDKPNCLEIVDGQQRLTFLTLLGCSLIRAGKCGEAQWETFVRSNSAETDFRLFFTGRDDDRKDIQRFLGEVVDGTAEVGNPAFVRFAECFKRFADGMADGELPEYSEYCFSHAAFLMNELPAGYGAAELNLHFEKMNSTGRQLSPLEVVKGKWFSPLAARWNRCMNFDEEFTRGQPDNAMTEGGISLNLRDVISGSDVYKRVKETGKTATDNTPPKSRLVMRPEILALHALCCLYRAKGLPAPSIQRSRLIETFKTAFEDGFSAADCLAELEKYREWMDANIVYLRETDGDVEYAFRREPGPDASSTRRMKQFQSMLRVASEERQEWVLNAYWESGGRALTYEALRGMERGWHSEEPGEAALRYGQIARYWFWKLEYLLWELHEDDKANPLFGDFDAQEHNLVKDYHFVRENRSIEHLHPQSKGGGDWGSRENPEAAMHRFGNLALMSTGGNSAQSDDGIDVKFGRVKAWLREGRLESIKMLLMFHIADKRADGWIVEAAQKHEDKMIDLLKKDLVRQATNVQATTRQED